MSDGETPERHQEPTVRRHTCLILFNQLARQIMLPGEFRVGITPVIMAAWAHVVQHHVLARKVMYTCTPFPGMLCSNLLTLTLTAKNLSAARA